MANNMTTEQQKVLNDMAEYGKHLQKLAFANTGKYVVAGYAGDSTDSSKLYCYCGDGNGYKGAPIVPANGTAAERKASLLKYSNGYGERIILRAMPAAEYFWLVFDDICKAMQITEQLINSSHK